ncbi:MAG: VWA domain-containing protein [Chloracidobacterium sp.]|nr:VWA domain-containing protein [Chloracidobacterium sp.]
MKSCVIILSFLAAFLTVILPAQASAQGVIVPIVCDRRPCRPPIMPRPLPLPVALPVKSITLDTKIVGQVATTHVEQVFRNDTAFTLEGTYFFPLPSDASIVEFAIWENGKRLAGEVRPRDEARRIYDEIVMRQRDPGLLEYAGKNLLQASIFPIPPHSDKKIELRYTQVLKADSGTIAYRYPLGTGRNLWRRGPREIESRRPAPPQSFGTISGKITIEAKQPVRNIYSPTHKIEAKQGSGEASVVTFESSDNDNDLSLFYGLGGEELGISLLTHREPGKDGYFMLMLSPRAEDADARRISKDIVFVLDTSGSMSDEGKMDKARAALLFGIRSLDGDDRFNVIGFAGEESLMESGLVQADAAGKRRAEEFVSKLRPSGGTNINDALVAAVRQFTDSGPPGMLVFMTDGLPTVGERNVEKILENLRSSKKADIRIFPFGFGYDVNTLLLDKLGSDNSGISDYVQPKEDLEVKVSNFFERVSSPVLSDIEIDLGRIDADLVYPRKPGDLFKGMQITMIGRYRNSADLDDAVIRLTGSVGGQSKTFRYPGLSIPIRAAENEFLPRLWASRRVGWLVEQVRINGESKELKDEIIELGLRFGLVTPYTSYLATDGSVTSVTNRSQLSDLAAAAPAKMAERSGAGAVTMSVRQNAMRTNSTIFEEKKKDAREKILIDDSENNRFFGSKNFVRKGTVWVDSAFEEGSKLREVTVRFASREYLDLAAENPELARYLSIGEEVIVIWRGTVYRVVK